MFDRLSFCHDRLSFPLAPRMAIRLLFNRENLNLVLIWFMTPAYFSFFLCATSSAMRLYVLTHWGPMSPVVLYTKGTKEPFSIFMLSSFPFRFSYTLLLGWVLCMKEHSGTYSDIWYLPRFLQLSWRIPLQDSRSFGRDSPHLTLNDSFPIIRLSRPEEIA